MTASQSLIRAVVCSALTLHQTFQMLTGTLGSTPISDANMHGEQITFKAGDATYTGRVAGNSMKGTATGGKAWTATRR